MDDKGKTPDTDEPGEDLREPRDSENSLEGGPACRCKEAQGKTITDFIRVMIDDLAFWRRKK